MQDAQHVPDSPRPDPRQQLGRDGEAAARAALLARGYVILAERFRVSHGEIDVIARHGETLVFVEVKTRRDARFGGGSAAITWRKQRKIARVAEAFLARSRLHDVPCRFDVVVVDWPTGDTAHAEVIAGAFDV